jgi:hypothetical protein
VSGLAERAAQGLRSFSLYRDEDVSGVSGTGVVVEGVVFSTGLTVIHWLTPPPRGSLNVFDSFEQFMAIHVGSHPENRSVIEFSDGAKIEPGDWHANPSPFPGPHQA